MTNVEVRYYLHVWENSNLATLDEMEIPGKPVKRTFTLGTGMQLQGWRMNSDRLVEGFIHITNSPEKIKEGAAPFYCRTIMVWPAGSYAKIEESYEEIEVEETDPNGWKVEKPAVDPWAGKTPSGGITPIDASANIAPCCGFAVESYFHETVCVKELGVLPETQAIQIDPNPTLVGIPVFEPLISEEDVVVTRAEPEEEAEPIDTTQLLNDLALKPIMVAKELTQEELDAIEEEEKNMDLMKYAQDRRNKALNEITAQSTASIKRIEAQGK